MAEFGGGMPKKKGKLYEETCLFSLQPKNLKNNEHY
jgi:hypothetical protein